MDSTGIQLTYNYFKEITGAVPGSANLNVSISDASKSF